MTRTLATTAAALTLLGSLAACSSSSPGNDNRPTATSTGKPQAGDPVKYLYDVDEHRHPQTDVKSLVHKLRSRCADDTLGLEHTATNTATGLVDAEHAHQDVYPVLAQLAGAIPRGTGKFRCAPGLPAVAKQIKANRAATASPTRHTAAPRTATHQALPHTTAPAADDHGGATAQCTDGTLSYSQHHQGTCSHHHGVAVWYQ